MGGPGANLAPAIQKLPGRTVCVQSREFLDGWNNLCIPACLKFNYKMFIPTSLGRRLFGPAHKERVGRTTMYSPILFFLSSTTYASRPITKFLITICSKSCPNHPKAPWTYCLCTVPGVFRWLEQPMHPSMPQI